MLTLDQENDGAMVAVAYLDELAGVVQLKATQFSTISDGIAQLKVTEPSATEGGDMSTDPATKDGINYPQANMPSGAEDVTYSVYAGNCSNLEAAQKVRDHFDSGVLHKLVRKLVANFFNPIAASDYTCHGYVPVILGACAMSLGCSTLHTSPGFKQFFPTFKDMMLGVLPFAPLVYGARVQMATALNKNGGFQSGTPIDFANYARPLENVFDVQPDAHVGGMVGGVYQDYAILVETDKCHDSIVSPILKAQMGYSPNEKVCGGCGIEPVKALVCTRCKDQIYCNTMCQRKDYRRHKQVCRTPEDAKAMDEHSIDFQNPFIISLPNVEPVFTWHKTRDL